MTKLTDWMPSSRHAKLDMANAWADVLTEESPAGPGAYAGSRAEAWGIPEAAVTELDRCIDTATAALTTISEKESRTEVATAAANTAFAELAARMRDIKRRYFFAPPLTDADFVALGLRVPDATHTPAHTPTAEVTVETFLKGRHQLGVRLVYLTGSETDPANKGYRVWWRVTAHGEEGPATPDDLVKSFYTSKRKDVIDFDYADSGKTAWMAVQVENEGKKGPWGPLVSAVIP